MKKFLIISVCIITSVFITACSSDNQTSAPQTVADVEEISVLEESVMPQESSVPVSDNTQQEQDITDMNIASESINASFTASETVNEKSATAYSSSSSVISSQQEQEDTVADTTPDYPAQTFKTVDELVAWIENNNAATYQDGRFKNSASSLKSLGKILYPTYPNSDIELRFIELLPDGYDPNGYAVVAFYYYTGDKRGVIYVSQMNESYAKQANDKGISGYMEAQYGSQFANAPLYEAEIETKNELMSRSSNQSVSYVKVTIESDDSGISRTQTAFLSDGFEVNLYQQKDADDDRFIDDICLEDCFV